MIVNEYSRLGRGAHKHKQKIVCVLRCDMCDHEFEKNRSQLKNNQFHFCSRKCQNSSQKKGLLTDEKKRQVFQKRLGVDNPSKSDVVRAKKLSTCRKNYGIDYGFLNMQKRTATMKERYGVEFPLQSAVLLKKAQLAWNKKYGVDNPMKRHVNKQKARDRIRSRPNMMVSKKEIQFGGALKEIYENVNTQVLINDWSIDFYIRDIDTYVQFDGSFWHGHSPHARKFDFVKRRMLIDKKQNEWFYANKIRLVRVSEEFFEKNSNALQIKEILEKF